MYSIYKDLAQYESRTSRLVYISLFFMQQSFGPNFFIYCNIVSSFYAQ